MLGEPPFSKLDLRFSVRGIPIRVHPLFWLVTVFIGWNLGSTVAIVTWIAAVFISILIHEMGHAQCAKTFGHSPRIVLYSFGGLAIYHPRVDEPTWRRTVVLVCGPLAGFLFAGVLIVLQASIGLFNIGYLQQIYFHFLWINIGWGLLNLLPILPLDGGQIAYTLINGLTPFQATNITRILSVLTAAILSLVAFTSQQPYLALFFAYFAVINWQG